jgi:hypothetical protein
MALPRAVGQLVPGEAASPGAPIFAVAQRANGDGGGFDIAVVDGDGHRLLSLVGYQTVDLPLAVEPDLARLVQDGLEGRS